MKKSEQMLFALLRASLHEKEVEQVFFHGATDNDWKQCYQIAISQGIMALAWDGVLRLLQELHPARNLKLAWAMAVERYEAKYRPIAKEETSTSIRIVPANELLNRDLNPRDVVLFRY